MEVQRVISVIRELTNKTVSKGCTEAEAMSAARKIGELLMVYNLSMDQVFLGESKCITGRITTGQKNRHPVDGCVVTIAEFCDCRVWFNRTNGASEYCFFGIETDVEMAKYLYSNILAAIESETQRFKGTNGYSAVREASGQVYRIHRKRLTTNFQRGMVCKISKRLREIMGVRHVEERRAVVSGGTSLVVLKNKKVEDEFEKLNLGLRKHTQCKIRVNLDAWQHGQAAGDRVNLNRPLAENVTGYLSVQ